MPLRPMPRLAAAMTLSVVAMAGCKPKESAEDARLNDRLVAVAIVAPALSASGGYTGLVAARVESDLGFRIPGKVIQRLVDAGQSVVKGQPLMRMDPTDYTHALVAQTGNVAAARARWLQAAADERRTRGLVAGGAVSQSAYDQVKAASDAAKALLDAALAQQQVARNQQDYALLLADADGTVMDTDAEPGQVVSAGQVVVRLAHAGPREAVVNLSETLRPALGSAAQASLYGGQVKVAAHLRQLSDAADTRTRTFEAKYVMDGAGASAPLGATVTLQIAAAGQAEESIVAVPLGALDDEGHGPGVWVVDRADSTVSYLLVKVQNLSAEMAEVTGPALGATIVATGGHYLHEGEKVRITTIRAAMR